QFAHPVGGVGAVAGEAVLRQDWPHVPVVIHPRLFRPGVLLSKRNRCRYEEQSAANAKSKRQWLEQVLHCKPRGSGRGGSGGSKRGAASIIELDLSGFASGNLENA